MVQVAECPLSKLEAMSSTPVLPKRKKQKKKKKKKTVKDITELYKNGFRASGWQSCI
jgi:hypothetical protein